MSHYKANVRGLEFNLFEVLDLGTLLDRGVYGDLDCKTAKAILNEVAQFSKEVVAESFVEADRDPVQFIPENTRSPCPTRCARPLPPSTTRAGRRLAFRRILAASVRPEH
jgi:hypothetical protein